MGEDQAMSAWVLWLLENVFGFLWNLTFFFYVYLFWRERESPSEKKGGAEREGDTESEVGSRLWAISPEGLEPTDCEIMTWAEVGRLTDWATQVPQQ